MQLNYLDIPYMYARTERGMEFIQALVDDSIRKDDVSLFGLASVQIIIEHHEKYWKKRNLLFFGLPLLLQLIIFWLWSNLLLPGIQVDKENEYSLKEWTEVCNVSL